MKTCYRCGERKGINAFARHKGRRDGRDVYCKECNNKARKLRYDNFERKSPEKRFQHYQAGARTRGLSFEISLEEFKSFLNAPCSYCGDLVDGFGIDRIDNSLGYVARNICPACSVCNRMKLGMTRETFIARCKAISERCF